MLYLRRISFYCAGAKKHSKRTSIPLPPSETKQKQKFLDHTERGNSNDIAHCSIVQLSTVVNHNKEFGQKNGKKTETDLLKGDSEEASGFHIKWVIIMTSTAGCLEMNSSTLLKGSWQLLAELGLVAKVFPSE